MGFTAYGEDFGFNDILECGTFLNSIFRSSLGTDIPGRIFGLMIRLSLVSKCHSAKESEQRTGQLWAEHLLIQEYDHYASDSRPKLRSLASALV